MGWEKKKKMILLFVGSAVFCLVDTSFYSEVISGKWGREGGWMGGWMGGQLSRIVNGC